MITTTDVRRLALEVVGNGLLVFLAVSAAVAGVAAAAGLELAGFGAWPDTVILLLGLIVLGWAYDTGPLRRIHLSPAVTGAALLGGRISGGVAVNHWLAQGLGLALAGVGLWFGLPWLLPDAPGGTALQAGQPIAFSPDNIIIAAVLSVVLLAVPFIVAATLATLRGPDVATLVAQAAAADKAGDAEAVAEEATSDVAEEAAADPEGEPAPVEAAPEPVTAEAILEDLEELFVPVTEDAEPEAAVQAAPPVAPAPEAAPPVAPAAPALSPAAALFSSAEREAHLKEFLGIPTRVEAETLLREATAAPASALAEAAPAEEAPAPESSPARPETITVPTVLARTEDTRGNLAIVRALPAPVADDRKRTKKGKKRKKKGTAPIAQPTGDTYTVTVNINMADVKAAAQAGKKKSRTSKAIERD